MATSVLSRAGRPTVAEFFSGIGLARRGLEDAGFQVVWSNDIEPFKARMYASEFGEAPGHELVVDDIANVRAADVPTVDVAWSSFPCTDLSLAGARAGLGGPASGAFYEFMRIMRELKGRRPRSIVIENVHGFVNSRAGEDFADAVRALNELDYSVDVLSIDARRFVPQSRPRLFMVATLEVPGRLTDRGSELRPDFLEEFYGDPGLRMHKADLPPLPAPLTSGLGEQIESMARDDARWWSAERVALFEGSLSRLQAGRYEALKNGPEVVFRTAYRRTRGGRAVWEIRHDDVSGCLRTARGGSSKQAVVRLGSGEARVRWMSPLEYARLMGAGDYKIHGFSDRDVLFGFGDAVCVPAVSWLASNYLRGLALAPQVHEGLRVA